MKQGSALSLLALGQALSLIGSRMSGVAVGFAVYATTGAAAPLLLFSFFAELPATLIGGLAGAHIDGRDARKIAVLADAVQALASALLAASFLLGFFSVWILYAVGLTQGFALAFQEPASQVVLSRLVPDRGRDRANALLGAAHPAASLLAPALAGLLYPLIGIGGIVGLDLATFLLSAATLLALRLPSPPEAAPQEGMALLGSFAEGLRFLRGEGRTLARFVLVAALCNFLLNGPLGLAIPYLLARTGSEAATGLALSLEGAGGLAGSALMALLGSARSRTISFLRGMLLAGASMVFLAFARSPLLIGLGLFATIASLQTWSRLSSTVMARAPEALRARVLSLSSQLGYLGATASFLLFGPLADRVAEPAARGGRLLSPLFGGPGGGMGFLIGVAGLLLLLLAASTLLSSRIRALGRPEGS